MSRLAIIDVLRGYALVCIMLSHMPQSWLADATIARLAVFDAAELFVFLSGFLVALVWERGEPRTGVAGCRRRFFRRALEIYRGYAVTGLMVVALSALLTSQGIAHWAIWPGFGEAMLEAPVLTAVQILGLHTVPNLVDVLVLYVFLVAVSPLCVPLLRRHPLMFTAGSLLVWMVAEPLNAAIPTGREEGGFVFNPFAWQLLFFAAATAASHRRAVMAALRPWRPVLAPAAVALLAAGLVYRFGGHHGLAESSAAFAAFRESVGPVDKWSLDPLRLISVLAAAWLVALVGGDRLDRVAASAPGRALAVVGRQGLASFAACVMLSLIGDALARGLPAGPLVLAVDVAAVVALYALARLSQAWHRRERPLAEIAPALASTAAPAWRRLRLWFRLAVVRPYLRRRPG